MTAMARRRDVADQGDRIMAPRIVWAAAHLGKRSRGRPARPELPELERRVSNGERSYTAAKQIFRESGVTDPEELTNLSNALVAALRKKRDK